MMGAKCFERWESRRARRGREMRAQGRRDNETMQTSHKTRDRKRRGRHTL